MTWPPLTLVGAVHPCAAGPAPFRFELTRELFDAMSIALRTAAPGDAIGRAFVVREVEAKADVPW